MGNRAENRLLAVIVIGFVALVGSCIYISHQKNKPFLAQS